MSRLFVQQSSGGTWRYVFKFKYFQEEEIKISGPDAIVLLIVNMSEQRGGFATEAEARAEGEAHHAVRMAEELNWENRMNEVVDSGRPVYVQEGASVTGGDLKDIVKAVVGLVL